MSAGRTAAGVVLAGGVLLGACGGVESGSARPGTPPPAPVLQAPLQTAIDAGGNTYAVVAMGNLGQPANTFWQLVARPPGDTAWTLVTPPGVADNGGLVVASGGRGRLTAAFLPSGALQFSPLAVTADGGTSWSAAGLVSGAPAAVPDALVVGSGGDELALEAGGAGVLAESSGGSWAGWVTAKALAATSAGRACGLRGLTGVALEPNGTRLVGATCAQPVAGVLVQAGAGGWALARVPLPPALDGSPVSVLRLVAGSPVTALVAGGGTQPQLAACWAASVGGPWRSSPALAIGGGATLLSTGFGPVGESVVLWRDRAGTLRAAADPGAGRSWTVLPDPPAGSQVLVAGAGDELDALTVSRTVLTDWRLDPGRRRWTRGAQLVVPIAFGSSG